MKKIAIVIFVGLGLNVLAGAYALKYFSNLHKESEHSFATAIGTVSQFGPQVVVSTNDECPVSAGKMWKITVVHGNKLSQDFLTAGPVTVSQMQYEYIDHCKGRLTNVYSILFFKDEKGYKYVIEIEDNGGYLIQEATVDSSTPTTFHSN
jgi:hypothetical protein